MNVINKQFNGKGFDYTMSDGQTVTLDDQFNIDDLEKKDKKIFDDIINWEAKNILF